MAFATTEMIVYHAVVGFLKLNYLGINSTIQYKGKNNPKLRQSFLDGGGGMWNDTEFLLSSWTVGIFCDWKQTLCDRSFFAMIASVFTTLKKNLHTDALCKTELGI